MLYRVEGVDNECEEVMYEVEELVVSIVEEEGCEVGVKEVIVEF